MEPDAHEGGGAVRRRRRVGRTKREKTPDPNFVPPPLNGLHRKYSEDDSSQVEGAMPAEESAAIQTVRMQIRPPSKMSAHESKILRRRDKTFASAAARSHSQPRQAERISAPEADDLLRSVKRSLSSPRHKNDESSEYETSTQTLQDVIISTADENLSRLEQNLRRFEEERKRFEAEKRQFEREKRKQMFDNEERKRLLQNYRKLSDRINLPSDVEERRRLVHSLRLQRHEVPAVPTRQRRSGYDESSTQFSSSDPDTEEATARRLAKQLSPVRRHASAVNEATLNAPPKVPERRSASRNNSLSPIRPQRRSKTPEQYAQLMRQLEEAKQTTTSVPTQKSNHLKVPQLNEDSPPDEVEIQSKQRKSSLPEIARKRRQSLEEDGSEIPSNTKAILISQLASIITNETEILSAVVTPEMPPKISLLERIFNYIEQRSAAAKAKQSKANEILESSQSIPKESPPPPLADRIWSRAFLRQLTWDARHQWLKLKAAKSGELKKLRRQRNKCISELLLLFLFLGFGGFMFRYTEGVAQDNYKCEVRKVKRDFIDNLWAVSHNMREDDWKSLARQKLRRFEEELHALGELGIRRHPSLKSWNFVNCIVYCWNLINCIGYGNIVPETTIGRVLTILYALIGVPILLIVLTDFGQLFTRAFKFLWSYVRLLYFTGSCRKNIESSSPGTPLTDNNNRIAMSRPSQFIVTSSETDEGQGSTESERFPVKSQPRAPIVPDTFEVNDTFNLPISVAIALLMSYMVIGALLFTIWEDWTYFESFYFVFISMSTIGFGDYVPQHPMFMMCTILYYIFGLSLMSMFINVVKIQLTDSFRIATMKISQTIGMDDNTEFEEETDESDENDDDDEFKKKLSSIGSAPSIDAMRSSYSEPATTNQKTATTSAVSGQSSTLGNFDKHETIIKTTDLS